jgi:hypothetical protein
VNKRSSACSPETGIGIEVFKNNVVTTPETRHQVCNCCAKLLQGESGDLITSFSQTRLRAGLRQCSVQRNGSLFLAGEVRAVIFIHAIQKTPQCVTCAGGRGQDLGLFLRSIDKAINQFPLGL